MRLISLTFVFSQHSVILGNLFVMLPKQLIGGIYGCITQKLLELYLHSGKLKSLFVEGDVEDFAGDLFLVLIISRFCHSIWDFPATTGGFCFCLWLLYHVSTAYIDVNFN